MNTLTLSRINGPLLYRLACWSVAAICMFSMSITLYRYLQTDPIAYLPAVGQWLIGGFLSVMLVVTPKGIMQLFNLIWLAGLAVIAAVF